MANPGHGENASGAGFARREEALRVDFLPKLKRVLAHVPGKGKHAGRMGALLVEMPSGPQFRLGAGFSDAQRADPPPVGTWVTYRFRGTHDGGLPRFASFVRVREDMPR